MTSASHFKTSERPTTRKYSENALMLCVRTCHLGLMDDIVMELLNREKEQSIRMKKVRRPHADNSHLARVTQLQVQETKCGQSH
ncbi:hypothetical protein ANCCAN_17386 [Ancylostoma caninum]|uniref:Uncharacterized protein n=1 Tax=Ancylostoma caninum TaxID=29170 RepID=A0A368G0C4_ANCCA|nr:hypothetical protein ANCCAN_17386 [Ancylostoma caninum]